MGTNIRSHLNNKNCIFNQVLKVFLGFYFKGDRSYSSYYRSAGSLMASYFRPLNDCALQRL